MLYKQGGNISFVRFSLLLLCLFISAFSFSQNPKIKCYFNHPVNNTLSSGVKAIYLNGSFPDTIVAYINRAKYSLDIAIYNYVSVAGDALSKYATAVNNAKARGVKVRWIYDGSSSNTGLKLVDTSIHRIGSPTSSGYGIMHNKFVVIDANSTDSTDAWVLTGSCNWTSQQITTDYNNLLFIQNRNVAQLYYTEFNKMWGGTGLTPDTALSTFGPKKTTSLNHLFNVNGTNIEVYFSPKDTVGKYLKSVINAATNELFFGIYTFTDNAFATPINTRLSAGVSVRGIMDNFSLKYTPYTTLSTTLGANMILYTGAGLYHNKILLKDALHPTKDPIVFTGSFNWSTAAQISNDENAVVVHDPYIANQYYQSLCQNFTDLGGAACIAPLPVNLISFKAIAIDNHTNKIDWSTTADNNTVGFILQKSYDKENYFPISNIPFSNTNIYAYLDKGIEQNTTYYRLKQVDKSGNFQYSFVIAVSNKAFSSLEIFPNPAQSSINIKSSSLINKVVIFDSFGKKVNEINIKENSSTAVINISNLSSGQYFVEVINRDNKYVQTFLKH